MKRFLRWLWVRRLRRKGIAVYVTKPGVLLVVGRNSHRLD
jgi:hypothetical protein